MTAASSRLDYLDALRALLIFFVVCIHGLGYADLPPGPARSIIEMVVSPVAVQGFYLVDGVLFARLLERRQLDAASFLWGATRRLLWPWLLFATAYLVARYFAERHGFVEPTALFLAPPSAAAIAGMVWWSEPAPQLYFLPSLLLIRVAAVAGRSLFDCRASALIGCGAALLLLFRAAIEPAYGRLLPHEGFDPLLHALGGLGFFVLGAGFQRLGSIGTARCLAALGIGLAVLVLGVFVPVPARAVAIQLGYATALYFLFASGVFAWPVLAAIGRRTMGIYLLHMPVVMKLCTLAANRLVDPTDITAFGIVVVGSFAAALALTVLIGAARLSGFAFGERPTAARPAQAAAR